MAILAYDGRNIERRGICTGLLERVARVWVSVFRGVFNGLVSVFAFGRDWRSRFFVGLPKTSRCSDRALDRQRNLAK